MSFFDRPDEPYAPAPIGPHRTQPPVGESLGRVDVSFRLAESPTVTVRITITRAFPDGFEFEVEIKLKAGGKLEDLPEPFFIDDAQAIPRGGSPDELFRLGIEYPGGGRDTTLPWVKQVYPGAPRPVMFGQSGWGGVDSHNEQYWVIPLPSPGVVRFVAEWPRGGIAESWAEVDSSVILAAARG